MGRRKKHVPKAFESINGNNLSANIYATMMQSTAYIGLSKGAKVLYQYMKLQYYGQKPIKDHPNSDFYFNQAMATKLYHLYTNMSQFRKDRDQLVKNGFIEVVECGRTTRTKNIYRFSDKWQSI